MKEWCPDALKLLGSYKWVPMKAMGGLNADHLQRKDLEVSEIQETKPQCKVIYIIHENFDILAKTPDFTLSYIDNQTFIYKDNMLQI